MTTFLIDSSKRDQRLFQVNNDWIINFSQNYENIHKIKLLGGFLCNSQYIINANNKIITVNYLGVDYPLTLQEGNYTPITLSAQIQTTLNSNSFAGTFTITSTTLTTKLTFACNLPVIYRFSLNVSLGRITGFSSTDTIATTNIIAPNVFQITTTRYYSVFMKEIKSGYDVSVSNHTFLIPNNVNAGEFCFITPSTNINNSIDFPQGNIQRLSIKIYDEDGFLVLFNGAEYSLILHFDV